MSYVNNLPDELRIRFKTNETAATNDKNTFKAYLEHRITAETGARLVGHNNDCTVTPEQFRANADWLGYIRDRISMYEDEDEEV